jgi:hypothetical protein
MGRGEAADQVVLDRAAGLGAVQVDDVHPLGALVGEGGQAGDRIGVVLRHLVETAVHQPHALAAAKVDGGVDDHAGSSRKFFRMRAPASAERSGWNWQPQRLPLRTMAGTEAP